MSLEIVRGFAPVYIQPYYKYARVQVSMAFIFERATLFMFAMILGMIAPFWVFLIYSALIILLVPLALEIVLLVMLIEYLTAGFIEGSLLWAGYFLALVLVESVRERFRSYAT